MLLLYKSIELHIICGCSYGSPIEEWWFVYLQLCCIFQLFFGWLLFILVWLYYLLLFQVRLTMVNSFLCVSNLFCFRIGWLAPFLVRPCCVRHTLCVRYTLCVRNTLYVRQAPLGIIYQIISQVQSSSTSDLYS